MWKKFSIFFLVSVLALSSLFSYPAWVYGKKEEEALASATPATETTTPAEELSLVQETQETSLNQARESLETTSAKQKEDLNDYLKESKFSQKEIEQVSKYLDNVFLGFDVMEQAYNLEVENHKKLEEDYNRLLKDKKWKLTLNPMALYSIKDRSFGVGLSTILSYKGYGLSLTALKPSLNFKDYDDVLISAGLAFTF